MGKVYDGLHRISFLINEEGVIEHVFNKFKTKDHHEVVVKLLERKRVNLAFNQTSKSPAIAGLFIGFISILVLVRFLPYLVARSILLLQASPMG